MLSGENNKNFYLRKDQILFKIYVAHTCKDHNMPKHYIFKIWVINLGIILLFIPFYIF